MTIESTTNYDAESNTLYGEKNKNRRKHLSLTPLLNSSKARFDIAERMTGKHSWRV